MTAIRRRCSTGCNRHASGADASGNSRIAVLKPRRGRFLIYRGVFANFERGYSLVAVCVIQLSTSLQHGRVAPASNPLRLSPIFTSNPPSHRTEMLKLISLL